MSSVTYKFRAECLHDAEQFFNQFGNRISKVLISKPDALPDVDVTFDSKMPLVEIMAEMTNIPDSHVMRETINFLTEYTGKR